MLLMIDNYDSFTFNLVQHFAELGEKVKVVRNDEVSVADVAGMKPDYIVISPGPCSPSEAGVSKDVIRDLAGVTPILGVCLGHQCMAEVFGGKVVRAHTVRHGKTAQVEHDGSGVFAGLPSPLRVTRYHSLTVEMDTLPDDLYVNAWAEDEGRKLIMGMRHRYLPVEGVQFHPESFLTEYGHEMLRNFLLQKDAERIQA